LKKKEVEKNTQNKHTHKWRNQCHDNILHITEIEWLTTYNILHLDQHLNIDLFGPIVYIFTGIPCHCHTNKQT